MLRDRELTGMAGREVLVPGEVELRTLCRPEG